MMAERIQEKGIKGMLLESVKNYIIKAYINGKTVFEKFINDNLKSLFIIDTENTVKTDEIKDFANSIY